MFERYTQNARLVIFLARDEAMKSGSPFIESEHLLLGTLRGDQNWDARIGGKHGSTDSIRKEIGAKGTGGMPISGSVETPLSEESKRILLLAAEEADRLGHRQITPGHFLLAVLGVRECLAARLLDKRGVTIFAVREILVRDSQIS
jgi:ATP-dependent Clp protease ATP-binding subunit ClpC